jgi:8-oxo-dGTP pyrophosphatase MutT (NUDIX family)
MDMTFDGTPRASEPPYGAAIIVYRGDAAPYEYLILHRAEQGPNFEGDWAWTPPSGARKPHESIAACVLRELEEETGISDRPRSTKLGNEEWRIFYLHVPEDIVIDLSQEHDRLRWMTAEQAAAKCLPARVGEQIRGVAALVE